MSIVNFDDRNRAYVSEDDFMGYLFETAEDGDYMREINDVVYYYNSIGCKLAEYNRREGYGQTF